MLHQKKKVFGILFFALLVSATFLIKNIVGATVDSVGNSITGTNINIANVASYDVTIQFSGTLDSGDIVMVELIDTSLTTISDTYISTGSNEPTITINFNASTLSEGAVTLSGSIFDSGLNLITGGITTTVLLDTILPTFDGVASGVQYSGDVAITFSDINLSGATLNGTGYTSGDVISDEGSYIFIVTDTVGNTDGATFIIDKTLPTFAGVISGTYYSGDVTITFSDTATIDGTPISSGDTISTGGIHTLIVIDEANNQTGAIFTIDKTPPAISNITSGNYFSGNVIPTIVETNFSGATLSGASYTPATTITGEATYELIITDLANNVTAVTFTIDKTLPTAYVEYIPTSGSRTSGNVVAIITGFSESIVNQNTGVNIFVNNGSFTFTFQDLAGNPGSSTAMVDWIDNVAPTVSTGYISAGNTGNNGATIYYKDTITIRADVSDTGGSSLNTGSCEYTIDGSSRIAADYTTGYCYKSGLSPADDITITFRMQDTVGNITTGTTATYLYDNTLPTATDDANSTTGRIDVTVIITAVDTGVGISGTLYCIDTAGSCTPNISGASISVTGATNAITHKYVRYYPIDKLGNTGVIQTSAQINIDKETPLLTGTTTFSSSNGTNTGYAKTSDTITVLFSSHETLSTLPTLTISGAAYTGTVTNIGGNNYSGTYVMRSTDTQGIIGFNILMTDLVGNTGNIHTTSAITFDRTAPASISITSPTITSYRQTANTYTITRNTGTEINFGSTPIRIEYSNNGFLGGSYTLIITTGTNNNGSLSRTVDSVDTSSAQMRIIATDLAGNTATFTGNQYKIDSTPPTSPSFVYPVGGEFLKGGSGYLVTRTGGGDGNLSGKILERSTGSSFVTITTLGDGAFSYLWTPSASLNSSTIRLGIKYQDKGGLTSPYIQTTDFIVDSTKPTITFTDTNTNRRNYNATGTTTSGDALAGVRATGVLYRTDTQFDQYCSGGSTTVPVLTAEGTGYIYACVQDKAGNVTTGVQMYRIDKTAPLVSTGTSKRVNTATAMTITVTGDFAGISGYARSKLSGPGAITFTTAGSQNPLVSADTEGEYSLQVLVQDNASNIATGIVSFTRDITAPILTGSTASVSNSTVTFSFTGNEAGTVSYSGACGNGSLTTAISGRNTTTFSLANATYSTCKVQVTDVAGNGSSRLTIPTFTVNYSTPSGGGGGGGGGGGLAICLDSQLVCSNGKYVKKSGVVCQGGKLNTTCGIDVCIDGDYSGSPTDGLCKDPTKVEASTGIVVTNTSTGKRVTAPSPFNKELTDAYAYAFGVKITTVNNIEKANMQGVLIRSHLAKMMSEYAIKVLGQTPDTSRSCIFSDMQNQSEELKMYAIQACQLGLMGLKTDGTPATKFTPTGEVTRAIFGTTLSRALRGEQYNGGANRYQKHLEALQSGDVMKKIDKPFNAELRGYVMLMMMRADQDIIKSSYTNFTSTRGTKVFVANTETTATTSSGFTSAELSFMQNINKNYQFNEGYTAGDADIGIKYLQYFLKAQKIYTGTINGINGTTTVSALFQYQLDNDIIKDKNDPAAGYLGPTTRAIINPLLKTLLNP